MEDSVQAENMRVVDIEQLPTTSFVCEIPVAKDDETENNRSSVTFAFPENGSTKWKLTYRTTSTGMSEIELSLLSTDFSFARIKIEMDFLNEKRSSVQSLTSIKYKFKKPGDTWISSEFFSGHYTVNKKVIIGVQLRLLAHAMTCGVTNESKSTPTSLSDDLRCLLDEGGNGDLDLKAEGKALKVHQVILKARSPVLKACLIDDVEWEELEMPDVEYEVLERIVRYIYTDQIDVENETGKLYTVACKYAISGLMFLCEEAMAKALTVQNAAETLVFVYGLSKDMKTRVIDFMKRNKQEIMATEGFKALVPQNPQLALELFCALNEV